MRLRRAAGVLVAALAGVTVAGAAAAVVVPAHAGSKAAGTLACGAEACPVALHFGVATPGLPADPAALSAFSASLGVRPDVALSFTSFKYSLNAVGLRALAAGGVMPMVTLEPFDPDRPDVDSYPLRSIAAGTYDAWLRQQAATVKSVGSPVAVRFAHEMNAEWYPWGTPSRATDYVAAYRHVHDVFAAAGVTNATWVWSPALIDTKATGDLAALYPGSGYVDWTGLSVYYDDGGDSWEKTVAPTVAALARVAPGKPLYVAESGVLPGPKRAAMLHDLLQGALLTPRLIGITYFDIAARKDWRLDTDPSGLGALRQELTSGWYTPATTVTTAPAPLSQTAPQLSGTSRVGQTVTATTGTWRAAQATRFAVRWLRCTGDACLPTGATDWTYAPTVADQGRVLRAEVTATSPSGSTVALSAASAPVIALPDEPGRPAVEARDGAVKITFPPVPAGATGWLLTVDGKAKPVVPLGTKDYWLTGLDNGATVPVSLAAVAGTGDDRLVGRANSGTVAALPLPNTPYVQVSGSTLTLKLPRVASGTASWVVTLDGTAKTLAPGTETSTWPGLPQGTHTWTLAATTGGWAGGPGAVTPLVSGSSAVLATPDAPTVKGGAGAVSLGLPRLPSGATGWRVSLGATTYPDLPGSTRTFAVSGLKSGYATGWVLRAVAGTAASPSVSEPVQGRTTP